MIKSLWDHAVARIYLKEHQLLIASDILYFCLAIVVVLTSCLRFLGAFELQNILPMLFIGLVWVTSWVGYFFSGNESLAENLAATEPITEVSANVTKRITKHRPFFITQRQHIDVWNTALVPATLLKLDWWGRRESEQKQTKLPNHRYRAGWHKSKNVLCRPSEEIPRDLRPVNVVKVLHSSQLIEPPAPPADDFLPTKILRSLQNFFGFSDSDDEKSRSLSVPVVLVQRGKDTFEVWVNNYLVATLRNELQAKLMQQRLVQLLKDGNLDASQLGLAFLDGMPVLMAGNRFLFAIEKEIAAQIKRSRQLLAIDWINNLRTALGTKPLTLVEAQLQMYGLTPTDDKISGLASWYGPGFQGRPTATGETFNQNDLTAAHPSLPFHTYLQVTNRKTGKGVIVRINDRGPFIAPRTLDLSRGAARCLNSEKSGVIPYEAVILQSSEKAGKKLEVVSNF